MNKRTLLYVALFILCTALLGGTREALAEEEEAAWVVSHQVEGSLALAPDESISQWSQAHHGETDTLDGVVMEVMTVHNADYAVFLVARPFNSSLDMTGVAIYFNGSAFNSPSSVWGWSNGHSDSTDPDVASDGKLEDGELTVAFGRPLTPSTGSQARFEIGVLYDEAVKITSWNNGTSPTVLDFSEVPSVGLEFLAPIDLYPKTPMVYSAVILAGTLAIVVVEIRRYSR